MQWFAVGLANGVATLGKKIEQLLFEPNATRIYKVNRLAISSAIKNRKIGFNARAYPKRKEVSIFLFHFQRARVPINNFLDASVDDLDSWLLNAVCF